MFKIKGNGFALLTVIFILLVFTSIIVGLISTFSSSTKMAVYEKRYKQAFYIAEAGRAFGIKTLSNYSDFTQSMGFPITQNFNGGQFTLTTSNPQTKSITLNVLGTINLEGITYKREISSSVGLVWWGAANPYSIYSTNGGAGTTQIGNNAVINGDLYGFANINIGNNAVVNGSATSGGNITGGTVTGTRDSNAAAPVTPPTLDTSSYDADIAIAATYPAGNQTFSGAVNLGGNYYVHGNVTFGNSTAVSVTPPAKVVATGSVTVGNNVTFGDELHVIASGLITMGNNVVVGKNNLWYSSTSLTINNNGDLGVLTAEAGSVFISPGNVTLGNNVDFYGFIYSGGTLDIGENNIIGGNILTNFLSSVGNNTIISYNPSLVPGSDIQGLIGSEVIKITNWQEVY